MYGRVESIEWLTPLYVRVVLNGDGLADYAPVPCTDGYVNVAIPPPDAPYATPFALDELKELPREQRPFRRRITVRHWEPESRRLTLEFITHGDDGAVGPWAARAQEGDVLVFTGPAGAYTPDPGADWHLMAGDESALPAIAASLDAVPPGVPVVVRLACDGSEYEIPLTTRGDLDLAWVHRPDRLEDAVAALEFPAGRVHAFIHGEAGETRAVRRHLLADRGLDAGQLSCSPYWKRGLTDEAWRAIKAAWNAEVARDVT